MRSIICSLSQFAALVAAVVAGYLAIPSEATQPPGDVTTSTRQSVDHSLRLPEEGPAPVAIVVGQDAEVLDFCGPLEVFAFTYKPNGEPAFAPFLIAQSKDPVHVGGNLKVVPDHSFASAPQPKVIVVPAMNMDAVTQEMKDWIRKASERSDVTMSVCNGAFVLAKTGLLDGKQATAHHGGYFRFAGEFPAVKLKRGARFVEDGRFASAGDVSSGIDLALRVVQRYLGRETASQIADGIEYQGNGWLNPDSNQRYAKFAEPDEDHPVCPLCQMRCDRSISTVYNGKTYYFCHESEKKYFDEHLNVLERFIAEDRDASRALVK